MNTSLAALHDLHLPPEIGFWPPALGFKLLLGVLALGLCLGVYKSVSLWIKNKPKRKALKTIRQLEIQFQDTHTRTLALSELSLLLKNSVVQKNPEAASLFGSTWVHYLNQKNPDNPFPNTWSTWPYQACVPKEAHCFFAHASEWIRHCL